MVRAKKTVPCLADRIGSPIPKMVTKRFVTAGSPTPSPTHLRGANLEALLPDGEAPLTAPPAHPLPGLRAAVRTRAELRVVPPAAA